MYKMFADLTMASKSQEIGHTKEISGVVFLSFNITNIYS